MKEKIISDSDKINLSLKEESHFFDRKAKEIDGKKIQKIATAFANSDGGDFIIGIKDDKDEPMVDKRWSGYPDKESFNKVFQNIMEIKPNILLHSFLIQYRKHTHC